MLNGVRHRKFLTTMVIQISVPLSPTTENVRTDTDKSALLWWFRFRFPSHSIPTCTEIAKALRLRTLQRPNHSNAPATRRPCCTVHSTYTMACMRSVATIRCQLDMASWHSRNVKGCAATRFGESRRTFITPQCDFCQMSSCKRRTGANTSVRDM